MTKKSHSFLNRREFIKLSSGAVAAMAAAPILLDSCSSNGMPLRRLGRTGLNISVLTVGGYHIAQNGINDARVPVPLEESIGIVRGAIDRGVNFMDNAYAYGDSEEFMGKALLDGYREKVILMSKIAARTIDGANEQLETGLKRLQTEHLDIMQLHNITTEEDIEALYKKDGLIEWAVKKRDEGLFKYIGVTAHYKASILAEVIKRGFEWDVTLMPVNARDFLHPHDSFTRDVIPLCEERDIGVLAMKTNGFGSSWDPNLATPVECIRYAMTHPVASIVSGMNTFEIMKENVAAVKELGAMTKEEARSFEERFADLPEEIEIYKRHFQSIEDYRASQKAEEETH